MLVQGRESGIVDLSNIQTGDFGAQLRRQRPDLELGGHQRNR
jgi:hypothetical protein